MSENSFKDRIEKVISSKFGGRGRRLAMAAGISPSTITKWREGSEPTTDLLIKVVGASGVSYRWLALGEGDMFASDGSMLQKQTQAQNAAFLAALGVESAQAIYNKNKEATHDVLLEASEWLIKQSKEACLALPTALNEALKSFLVMDATHSEPARKFRPLIASALREIAESGAFIANKEGKDGRQSKESFVYIPLFDLAAAAGAGSVLENETLLAELAFRRDWISAKSLSGKDLAALRIKGDSMEPTLIDGDIVLIDRSKTDIVADAIYVLHDAWGLKIKRIQRLLNGNLTIASDNTIYNSETLTPADQSSHPIAIIGRAVWFGRTL